MYLVLAQQVLEVGLLLLGLGLPLVRAAFPLLAFVARQGASGFLHAALGPVHLRLVFVVPAAPGGHGGTLLSSPSFSTRSIGRAQARQRYATRLGGCVGPLQPTSRQGCSPRPAGQPPSSDYPR